MYMGAFNLPIVVSNHVRFRPHPKYMSNFCGFKGFYDFSNDWNDGGLQAIIISCCHSHATAGQT